MTARFDLATVFVVAACSSAYVSPATKSTTVVPLTGNHATRHDRVEAGRWLRVDRPETSGRFVFDVRPQPAVLLVVHDRDGKPIESSVESHANVVTYVVDPAPTEVRVMAIGDDGLTYDLEVWFVPSVDWSRESVPGPPDLPSVPAAPQRWCNDTISTNCRREVCHWDHIDPENPECDVRRRPQSCDVSPPDPASPACAATMPCPTPPDPRVKRCATAPVKAAPIVRPIERVDEDGDRVTLRIAGGTDQGIGADWRAVVIADGTDQPVPGGVVDIVRLDANTTVGRVRLSRAQLAGKMRVRFTAP